MKPLTTNINECSDLLREGYPTFRVGTHQNVVKLFDFRGHVAVQSKKIETYQTLHKQYPQRGGHYRDRVTSQLMVAA